MPVAAELCSGCAADQQPCPEVHQGGAGSSDPGTAALGLTTEGSRRCRRRHLPSYHAAHRAGTIAVAAAVVVHGDASLPLGAGSRHKGAAPAPAAAATAWAAAAARSEATSPESSASCRRGARRAA